MQQAQGKCSRTITIVAAGAYWAALAVATHWPSRSMPKLALPPDFLLHAVAFAGLALLLMLAVPMACCYRGRVAIVAVVSLYGLVDEVTQPMVGRSFMFADLGADVVGAVVGVFCGWVVAARRR